MGRPWPLHLATVSPARISGSSAPAPAINATSSRAAWPWGSARWPIQLVSTRRPIRRPSLSSAERATVVAVRAGESRAFLRPQRDPNPCSHGHSSATSQSLSVRLPSLKIVDAGSYGSEGWGFESLRARSVLRRTLNAPEISGAFSISRQIRRPAPCCGVLDRPGGVDDLRIPALARILTDAP